MKGKEFITANAHYYRDSVFGIKIRDVVWDILHGKMRILNKIIRNIYFNVDKKDRASTDDITEIIQRFDNTFKTYITSGKKLKIYNIRGN